MINDSSDISLFAETDYRNKAIKFGIKTDDRRRHMYLIGKTGMGKSTIQENMIVDDIRKGRGVAVCDPHGDLVEKVMEYIPDERINDVIYFNPSDLDYPIAFNIVEKVAPEARHLVASGLIGVFQKLWADSWGPRLEYILRNAILAILDNDDSSLLSVIRMLSDKDYREKIVSNAKDPVVRAFWENEFAGYTDKFASEAVAPIQNKVGQFLSSGVIRNIIGQTRSAFDVRQAMDEGKILLLNLSKGRIGEDNSSLLGAMMVTKIQLAAMSRVNISEKERKDFFLYIDEFQNFSTGSFATILSEARKYRLCLIIAHQYIEQLEETVRSAVFGNVGTMVIFRVGSSDAEAFAKEFAPVFTAEDIVNLPKYHIYLKLMINGVASQPFSAKGMAPLKESEKTGNAGKVVEASRRQYATPKAIVEEMISQWYGDSASSKAQSSDDKKKGGKGGREKEGFDAICSSCGVEIKTPFQPDGVRPVFCKDCMNKKKAGENVPIKNNGLPKNKTTEGAATDQPNIIRVENETVITNNSVSNASIITTNSPASLDTATAAVEKQVVISNPTEIKNSLPSFGQDSRAEIFPPQPITSGVIENKSIPVAEPNNENGHSAFAKVENAGSSQTLPNSVASKPTQANYSSDNKALYSSVCSICKSEVKTPFKPDGIRPVLCKKCIKDNKNKREAEVEARRTAKLKELEKMASSFEAGSK